MLDTPQEPCIPFSFPLHCLQGGGVAAASCLFEAQREAECLIRLCHRSVVSNTLSPCEAEAVLLRHDLKYACTSSPQTGQSLPDLH